MTKAIVLGWLRRVVNLPIGGQTFGPPRLHVRLADNASVAQWARVRLGGVARAVVCDVLPDRLVLRPDEESPGDLFKIVGYGRFTPDGAASLTAQPGFVGDGFLGARTEPIRGEFARCTRFEISGGGPPTIHARWLGQVVTLRGGPWRFAAPPNLGVEEVEIEEINPRRTTPLEAA